MAQFIRVTSESDGADVYINLDRVTQIKESVASPGRTVLHFSDERGYLVTKESLRDILSKIGGAR